MLFTLESLTNNDFHEKLTLIKKNIEAATSSMRHILFNYEEFGIYKRALHRIEGFTAVSGAHSNSLRSLELFEKELKIASTASYVKALSPERTLVPCRP